MNGSSAPERSPSHSPSASISTSLLGRIQQRDPDGWRRLTELYGPMVYLWARHAGVGPEDAEDLVQEIFIAVARGIGRYRHDRPGDSFRGWLWTIAQHKICDHFRQRPVEPQGQGGTDAQQRLAQIAAEPDSTWTVAPPADLGSQLERRVLELVQAGVENRTSQAFCRLTVDGLPPAEIARQLDMTVAAVYKAKYRVIRLVRQELDNWGKLDRSVRLPGRYAARGGGRDGRRASRGMYGVPRDAGRPG